MLTDNADFLCPNCANNVVYVEHKPSKFFFLHGVLNSGILPGKWEPPSTQLSMDILLGSVELHLIVNTSFYYLN